MENERIVPIAPPVGLQGGLPDCSFDANPRWLRRVRPVRTHSSGHSPLATKTMVKTYTSNSGARDIQSLMESASSSSYHGQKRKPRDDSIAMKRRRNRKKERERKRRKDKSHASWWSLWSKQEEGSDSETQDYASLVTFDSSILYDVNDASEKKAVTRAIRCVLEKRTEHHLLGSQFGSDPNHWIMEFFFRGLMNLDYRFFDSVRAAHPEGFSNVYFRTEELDTDTDIETCGSRWMTSLVVKFVKKNAKGRSTLVYEPK